MGYLKFLIFQLLLLLSIFLHRLNGGGAMSNDRTEVLSKLLCPDRNKFITEFDGKWITDLTLEKGKLVTELKYLGDDGLKVVIWNLLWSFILTFTENIDVRELGLDLKTSQPSTSTNLNFIKNNGKLISVLSILLMNYPKLQASRKADSGNQVESLITTATTATDLLLREYDCINDDSKKENGFKENKKIMNQPPSAAFGKQLFVPCFFIKENKLGQLLHRTKILLDILRITIECKKEPFDNMKKDMFLNEKDIEPFLATFRGYPIKGFSGGGILFAELFELFVNLELLTPLRSLKDFKVSCYFTFKYDPMNYVFLNIS